MERTTILILLSLLTLRGCSLDLCEKIKSCICTKDPFLDGGLHIKCNRATSDEISQILLQNATRLHLADSILEDPSVLMSFGLNKLIGKKNLTITDTTIDVFDWKWIPNGMYYVKLINTGTTNIYSERNVSSSGKVTYQCSMEHILDISMLWIGKQRRLMDIPSCLPGILKRLVIQDSPLSNLNYEKVTLEDHSRQLPNALTTLQLKNNDLQNLSPRLFQKSLPRLRTLRILSQNFSNTNFLQAVPGMSLAILILQNCSIQAFSEHDFTQFQLYDVLTQLKLSYNLLSSIPSGLPESIRILHLDNNIITKIDTNTLSGMRNLETLNMEHNLLKRVPGQLPRTIQVLNFKNNKITTCDYDAFVQMRSLRRLDLGFNNLTSMPMHIPRSIRQYSLQSNQIYFIGPESNYNFCSKCNTFEMNGNPWSCDSHMLRFLLWSTANGFTQLTFRKKVQIFCRNLPFSDLDNINVENIIVHMRKINAQGCNYNFTHLKCTNQDLKKYPMIVKGLHVVCISGNPILGNTPDFIFAEQSNLKRLELDRNGITRIPRGMPQSIRFLSLKGNNISHLRSQDAIALLNLTRIKSIYLDYNKFSTFLFSHTQPLQTLSWVSLYGNPLVCGCTLWPFIHWMMNKTTNNSGSLGHCTDPKEDMKIDTLRNYYKRTECIPKMCDWNEKDRVLNCSMTTQQNQLSLAVGDTFQIGVIPSIKTSRYWESIDLTGIGLKEVGGKFLSMKELKEVILSYNSFKRIPLYQMPKSIRNLSLNNNNIERLPTVEKLKYLPLLEYLDLRYNNIKKLDEKDVRLLPLMKKGLLLRGNPLVCNCALRSLIGWVSAQKDNKDVMKIYKLQELQCREPRSLRGEHLLKLEDEDYCSDMNIHLITVTLVAVVTIFIIAAISINVYLHKRRKKREKEDILRGFRELLQREARFDDTDPETGITDDRFLYDAFLSYSSDDCDTNFSMELLEELEVNQHYKICIHERDFVPGIGIADNIVECFGASKRIILVLSRHFISSSWCQYEVQVALAELHQGRRSKLLIPILLEDIEKDDNTAASIKTFLSLIHGIRVPHDQKESSWREFWEEVMSAMPEQPMGDQ